MKKTKINLIDKNFINYFTSKRTVNNAFSRLKYTQDQVAEQFYEILSEDGKIYIEDVNSFY